MSHVLQYGDGPQAIYDSLKARIIAGELDAGREIKIQAMAAEYGVSAVPVREAIRMLAADRLIDLRPRRSPVVTRPNLAEIFEINEIRRALEPIALRTAVPLHTDESLAACDEIIEEDRHETERWRRVQLNRTFHRALLAPSAKPRLLRTIEEQYEGITRLAQYLVIDKSPGMGALHVEHREILDAVARGDAEDAVAHLVRHIEVSTDRVAAVFAIAQEAASSARSG